MVSSLVTQSHMKWHKEAQDLLPGGHMVLLAGHEPAHVCFQARQLGLDLRDTVLVLRPGPAAELALLFRKPLEETSVVHQMLKTRTGALQIEACRVSYQGESDKTPSVGGRGDGSINPGIGAHLPSRKPNWEAWTPSSGRWPSNMVFVHGSACKPGVARVEGHKGYPHGPGGSSAQFSQKGTPSTRTKAWAGHADADGLETVPAWECEPKCAVKSMEDGWGTARFYPQFGKDIELLQWFETLLSGPLP